MITIVIADDHQMFREGIIALLSEEKDFNVVGEASNGNEVISILKIKNPDILLLDIEMPELDGFDTMRALKKVKTTTKIIVLTTHYSPEFIKNSIKAGASGYLKKDASKETLKDTIINVHTKGTYFSNEVSNLVLGSFKEDHITNQISSREKDIIKLISDGLTTKAIAKELFISPYTVESHRQNILLKLGLKNSAELIKYAIQKGLI